MEQRAEEVMEKLQAAGVAASIVSQGEDLFTSPHLKSREFYRDTEYYVAERGKVAAEWEVRPGIGWSMSVRLPETPMKFGHYSNIGEDNAYVFQELLGLPEAAVQGLMQE